MKEYLSMIAGFILSGVIAVVGTYLFEAYFWVGLLIYIPLYFFNRSFTVKIDEKKL